MVNKGVASWLLKDHLDKTALGAGQVEGLAAATFRIATFKGVGALLKNSVELGSDDVEGTPPACLFLSLKLEPACPFLRPTLRFLVLRSLSQSITLRATSPPPTAPIPLTNT